MPADDNHRPKDGSRYVVTTEFEAIVMTQWFAPFTGGYRRLLPVGLDFVVWGDPPSTATAVGARPVPYDRWQAVLVDAADINDELYGGYTLSITFDQLNEHCLLQH
jgi:hypothetical protein